MQRKASQTGFCEISAELGLSIMGTLLPENRSAVAIQMSPLLAFDSRLEISYEFISWTFSMHLLDSHSLRRDAHKETRIFPAFQFQSVVR